MFFRVTNNFMSQASRSVATSILVVGLLLLGFGMLILAMPEVFALLAALVFFILGLGCAATAVKILWMQYRVDRQSPNMDEPVIRRNVRIHTRHFTDL